ncbi:MAG: class I SAM-dependent methyltransferase, partial [Pirellulales bacterium]|nr:class I SAM-dependent methyltransferase [Pirellulales bacterium]
MSELESTAPAAAAPPAKKQRVQRIRRAFYSGVMSPRRTYRAAVEPYAASASKILDIGCGYAAPDLEALPTEKAAKIGFDMVDEFRPSEAPSVEFVHGDCHDLPFDDATFDVVMSRSVMEHLEHPDVVFAN